MAYYRLYFLDPHSGHIDRFEEYDARDDAGAIARAQQRLDDVPLELWSGARKVSRFEPAPGLFAPIRKLHAAGR